MAKACYVCKKELGAFAVKWSYQNLLYKRTPIPDGMLEDDVVCKSCFEEIEKSNKEEIKEAKNEQSEHTKQLLARTPEYKKQWDKNGVIQFKNDRVAILQRHYGAQVEFIIAFDDLTAEGYELKAIDEGKTGDSQGLSGGINSYFYFQKNEFIK
jgi:hypothetical protein